MINANRTPLSTRFARGFSLIELMIALLLGSLITIAALELFSTNPARILKLPGGTLKEGRPGDLSLFHPGRSVTVRGVRFKSKARNTPFEGWKLRGRPIETVVAGRVVSQQSIA